MKIAALVASRNRPDLVESMVAQLGRMTTHEVDVYVVECGSEREHISDQSTLWYPDDAFRGKCYGHNLALAQARQTRDDYDYVWVLMNDLVFDEGVDAAAVLVEQMEREPRMAILSPTNVEGGYPGAEPRPGGDWRAVTTCDYLGFMMKTRALDEVGFLSSRFSYCWGAIHELCFKLYAAGWFAAYSDRLSYRHLGGSTYGVPGTKTISREEYQRRAKRFAYDEFRASYGELWHERFLSATQGHAIEFDTFSEHRKLWLGGFEPDEIAERLEAWTRARADKAAVPTPPPTPAVPPPEAEPQVGFLSDPAPAGSAHEPPAPVRSPAPAPSASAEPQPPEPEVNLSYEARPYAPESDAPDTSFGFAAEPAPAAPLPSSSPPAGSAPQPSTTGETAFAGLVLAWPSWQPDGELEDLFQHFGPELQLRPHMKLAVFCHEQQCDRETALQALQQAYRTTLGSRPGPDLDVELLLGPLTAEMHQSLVQNTVAVIALPSLVARGAASLPGLNVPWVQDAAQLRATLGAPPSPIDARE